VIPRRRCVPGTARGARATAIGGLILVLLSTIACDRWRERFRLDNTHAHEPAPARTPLPDSGFRVRWEAHTVPPEMARGSSADARIAFTNVGEVVWPDRLAGDPGTHSGGYAVRLAYDWTAASAEATKTPRRRADLPHPVHPGETMTLLVPLDAPDQPGEYRLTFELVQELVAWFSAKGAATLVIPMTVK
jgi:hypothetical protein